MLVLQQVHHQPFRRTAEQPIDKLAHGVTRKLCATHGWCVDVRFVFERPFNFFLSEPSFAIDLFAGVFAAVPAVDSGGCPATGR